MRGVVGLFVRRGSVFIVPYSQTTDGFWIEVEPYLQADVLEPASAAAMVLEALTATRLDISTPHRDLLVSRLPELAGVKTYATFMRGAVSVDISRSEDGTIMVTPMRNGGARAGFEYIVERALVVDSSEQLAAAIVEALGAAE